jgi:hypothetical protein
MDVVVFVCNLRYLDKFVDTCNALIYVGEYAGDIVLLTGDDMPDLSDHQFIKKHPQIIFYRCPDIVFKSEAIMLKTNAACDKKSFKMFQYHKYHLFTEFFKRWDYVFYIDCGAKIYEKIQPILDTRVPNTLLAHSDAYPAYKWKLSCQFREELSPQIKKAMCDRWDLERDYFQSTIMLFDTSIIERDTFQELCDLTEKYPISGTNDQGILNLYFVCIKNKWRQIPLENDATYFYDFNIRKEDKPYIMTKYFLFND